jgi:hypothetical protein
MTKEKCIRQVKKQERNERGNGTKDQTVMINGRRDVLSTKIVLPRRKKNREECLIFQKRRSKNI